MILRFAIGTSALLALSGWALAGTVDQTLSEVSACAAISDNAQRLACYDKAAPKVRAALNVATEEDQADLFGLDIFGSDGGTREATRPEDFGKTSLPPAEAPVQEAAITEITAGLTEVARNGSGYDVYVLDNGQVWRQTESTGLALPRNTAGLKVTIKEGLLGSYILNRTGSNKSVKVKRVR